MCVCIYTHKSQRDNFFIIPQSYPPYFPYLIFQAESFPTLTLPDYPRVFHLSSSSLVQIHMCAHTYVHTHTYTHTTPHVFRLQDFHFIISHLTNHSAPKYHFLSKVLNFLKHPKPYSQSKAFTSRLYIIGPITIESYLFYFVSIFLKREALSNKEEDLWATNNIWQVYLIGWSGHHCEKWCCARHRNT